MKHWNLERVSRDESQSRGARAVALPLTRRTLTHGHLYFWYILLATLDLVTTVIILNLGGREANAVADFVLQHAGAGGLLVMKYASVMLVVCICEYVAERRPVAARFVALTAVALSAVPVVIGWAQLAMHA